MKYIIVSMTKAKRRDGPKFLSIGLAPLRDNEAQSQETRKAEVSIVDYSPDSPFLKKDVDDIIEIG